MRKQGAKFKKRLVSYLLTPEQVAKYVTPLHVGLTLLPLGAWQPAHANSLAIVINLISVDAADKDQRMLAAANRGGDVLRAMFERHTAGKAWNVTTGERKVLQECIVLYDRELRTWTSDRLLIAAATVDVHNAQFKANGGKFLDRVEITDTALHRVKKAFEAYGKDINLKDL